MAKTPTRTRLFLIFVFIFCFVIGKSQNIQSYFASQQPKTSFEKLYLHTDREFYFTGDTLWFSAYLVEGQTHFPIQKTFNLFVNLINSNEKIVGNHAFPIINGHCDGWVSLNDTTIQEGNYVLRAYTDYLKKFGSDAYFHKKIQLSSIKSSFELETVDTNKTKHDIDVSFLPEGGFLLADKPNCVAFKAVDESGKGVAISGKLLDENGGLVLNFKTVYKGTGKLYFNPKPGKSYTVKIDGHPGLEHKFDDIRSVGAKINLNNIQDDEIPIIIQANGINKNLPYYLVCLNRGEGIFSLKIDRKRLNSILKIYPRQLRGGINRFVLLNSNFVPVSERLIFVDGVESFDLNVQLNKDTFKTREKVQLQVFSPDNLWHAKIKASLSVIDENYVNASGVSQNIKSYLLLDSELKGNIESPADYFIDDENLSSNKKLDLLMTVNGWSNYIWNQIDTMTLNPEPQIGFTFKGNVKRRFGNKALEEGSVFMIIFNEKDSTAISFDQKLDTAGKFEFKDIVFFDSVSVFAQARNKNDNHNLQFEMELSMLTPPDVSSKNIKQLQGYSEIPVSLYRQRYLNEMHLKEYYPDKSNILIDEVQVTAKKPEPKWKEGTPMKNSGTYRINEEQTFGFENIIEYLAFRVPGVTPIYPNGKLTIKIIGDETIDHGQPGIFIDGFLYKSIDEARSYNIKDFAAVEIITPPMSTYLGARAINGAIILTLKSGHELETNNSLLLGGIVERIKGFSANREFYSPRYTPKNVHFEKPDYRNTLYWNPRVKIDKYAELSFFTCDNLSRYKIFIEGLSENGKICMGKANFKVTEKRVSGDMTNLDEPKKEPVYSTKTLSDKTPQLLKNQTKAETKKEETSTIDTNLIVGTIINEYNQAVEFATIYNINKKTSGITNKKGVFQLEAEIGDSIRIQHLNYQPNEYTIDKQNSIYILGEKSFHIDEAVISAQYAFKLFNKSCENTFNAFKNENLTRAYCNILRTDGSTITQSIDLDLDIEQKKRRKFKRGEKIIPYKIQEHIVDNDALLKNNVSLTLNLFHPLIHEIYWVDLPQHFNYYKKVDNENIILYLISKTVYGYPCNIEVTISKQDTLLKSFAMVKRNVTSMAFGDKEIVGAAIKTIGQPDTLFVDKTYHFISYKYKEGFGYLDEYFQGFVVRKKSNNITTELSQHLKTYNNGGIELGKRPFRRRLSDNSIIPELTVNRHENEFWNNDLELEKSPYDFNKLSRIEFDISKNEIILSKQEQPDLIVKNDSTTQSSKALKRYYPSKDEETLNFIAGINNVGIDQIFFMPYYLSKGKPVFSKKLYSIADLLPASGEASKEIKNKILEIYYSHEKIQKTKFGCKNFTCNENLKCVIFPFNNDNDEILTEGFAIYILKEN